MKYSPSTLIVLALIASCTVGESVNVEAEPGGAITVDAEGSRRIVGVDADALAAVLAEDDAFRADVVAALASEFDPLSTRVTAVEVGLITAQGDLTNANASITQLDDAISANSTRLAGLEAELRTGGRVDTLEADVAQLQSDLIDRTTRLLALEQRRVPYAVKSISSFVTAVGDIPELAFVNLTPGRRYRVSVRVNADNIVAGGDLRLTVSHNGNILILIEVVTVPPTSLRQTKAGSAIFRADAPTLTTRLGLAQDGAFLRSAEVILEELPHHEATSAWD